MPTNDDREPEAPENVEETQDLTDADVNTIQATLEKLYTFFETEYADMEESERVRYTLMTLTEALLTTLQSSYGAWGGVQQLATILAHFSHVAPDLELALQATTTTSSEAVN